MTKADSICTPESMDSEDVLFMLYTSGSTGKPKGIVHTQAGYLLYAALTHKVTQLPPLGKVHSPASRANKRHLDQGGMLPSLLLLSWLIGCEQAGKLLNCVINLQDLFSGI